MEKDLISGQFSDVEKTGELLQASIDKYVPFDIDHIYTSDELEYYDSLSFRFEKCVELTLNFFKTLLIKSFCGGPGGDFLEKSPLCSY